MVPFSLGGTLLLFAACDAKSAPEPSINAPSDVAPPVKGGGPEAPVAEPGADTPEEAPAPQAQGVAPPTGEAAAPGAAAQADTGGSERVERPTPGSEFGLVGTDEERYACRSDADCVMTKWRDGACCPKKCGTSYALNKGFEAKLAVEREKVCDRQCPVAKCARPKKDFSTKCVENSCVVFSSLKEGPVGL